MRLVAIAAAVAVLIVVGVMVAIALARGGGTSQASGGAGAAANLAQSVPVSVLHTVGAGQGVTPPKSLPSGTPALMNDGKPQVLYIGAEYCPFCATERWPVVVALSRFGRFTGLGGTESAPAPEAYPQTQTFTFHGATYASDVLSFAGVETNTNQPDPAGGFTPLQQPTPAQEQLLQRFDTTPYTTQPGAIPFLMIGNRYVSIGASYDPALLQGMSRDEIAHALSDPNSPVAQGVLGAANTLTAAICQATEGQPSSVCADPAIKTIASSLPTNP
jgi:hypothetical protein